MLPIGIDEWLEQGRKYKYLDYIRKQAINQTREETIREVEQLIPERKDGGKNFDQWQYYCQGYNDLRDYILNKLKK